MSILGLPIRARRFALVAAMALVLCPGAGMAPAQGPILEGRVVKIDGRRVTIKLDRPGRPTPGDPVLIYGFGYPRQKIMTASGRVIKIKDGLVITRMTEIYRPILKGMPALIYTHGLSAGLASE